MIVFLKTIYEKGRAVWLDLFDSGEWCSEKSSAAEAVVKCPRKISCYKGQGV